MKAEPAELAHGMLKAGGAADWSMASAEPNERTSARAASQRRCSMTNPCLRSYDVDNDACRFRQDAGVFDDRKVKRLEREAEQQIDFHVTQILHLNLSPALKQAEQDRIEPGD